ncbi:hypothetical protein M409DRAFT_26535 [Zasmidium cellare ATCC 36951]|uniref:Zn(2)-C6 fungal-type domain-containing protein n=1 Tax=Zasmidium cellare ATCC 36951 TaxID=1080233 RepID=A0A6A6CBP6_ZASCE|nr:uncharacterized protein M409DRAFT_26535 [Zasmidium cellare ATCC 36951]KAF2163089.1 hypothetical protein M409DRAFT_26535 [Zasmidium cellare ATCC 36951]
MASRMTCATRIRRIKCDEERPACERCTSTGRDCLGYEIGLPFLSRDQAQPYRKLSPRCNESDIVRWKHVPRPLAVLPSGLSPKERQAFHFFREQTSYSPPGLGGTDTTWEMIALQLSLAEPALMCAIVAVGSLHQARTTRSTNLLMRTYAPEQFQFAMERYSRAVGHVQQQIRSSQQQGSRKSVELVLLACLMFICVELLNGNNSLAIQHLQTGLRILYEHLYGPMPTDRNQRRLILKADPRSTLDRLSKVYIKLEGVAASMFGQDQPILLASLGRASASDPCPTPKVFASLNDAQLHLDVLTSAIYCARGELLHLAEEELRTSRDVSTLDGKQLRCLVSASSRLVNLGENPRLEQHIRALERSVAAWSSALACIPATSEHPDHQFRLLLDVQFFELWLTSSTWLDRTETVGDRFDKYYPYMLSRIEEYLKGAFQDSDYLNAPRAGGPLRAFALSQEILLPLFGIAMRSRDTRTRRRALLIPSRLHIQESLVDSDFLAAVMERIVDEEETAARTMNGFPPDRPLTCNDVPEAARFMAAHVSTEDGHGRVARLIGCQWAAPGDQELTLKDYQFTLGELGSPSQGSIFPEGAFPQKLMYKSSDVQ